MFTASLALNALMISGTPIYGGHYAVDILAGAGMVMTLVAIAHWQWVVGGIRTVHDQAGLSVIWIRLRQAVLPFRTRG